MSDTVAATPAPGAKSLLVVDKLVKYFTSSNLWGANPPTRAVDGVSFTIGQGKTLGLVGESGCGKSTLGRTILRLIEPTSGRVELDGVEITKLNSAALRRFRKQAQIIFQDPYASLNPRMTVRRIISEPLIIHRLASSQELPLAVDQLLERVNLRRELGDRYPHELSGGQRQRVGIARALAVKPKLIVADEPVSALDVSIQAQIINLLVDLQTAEGLTYLFISHDLKLVEHLADEVAVMYLGKIVEQAPRSALFAAPRHPYTKALLSAVPVIIGPAGEARLRIVLEGEMPSPHHPPTGCAFHPRCPLAAARGIPVECSTIAPELRQVGVDPGHVAACHFID